MVSEMTKMETNRGASQLRKYSINYSVAPCAGKCMQCSRVCSDNRVIEELLQQLPKHLILRSNEVRMLDISLGQGMLETITALKVIIIVIFLQGNLEWPTKPTWCGGKGLGEVSISETVAVKVLKGDTTLEENGC